MLFLKRENSFIKNNKIGYKFKYTKLTRINIFACSYKYLNERRTKKKKKEALRGRPLRIIRKHAQVATLRRIK